MSGVAHDGNRWSNADQDRVDLVPYDPGWPAQYEAEARTIRTALAGLSDFELAHFGSTAIPGLAAKPIIDIMLISAGRSAWPTLIEPIKAFGTGRTHHLHVRTPEDARVALVFCDHIRRHPEEAARYAALKRELAARCPTDRDAHTEGKARYVDDIVRRASNP